MLGKSQIKSDIYILPAEERTGGVRILHTNYGTSRRKKWILRDPSHCHIPYLIAGSVTDIYSFFNPQNCCFGSTFRMVNEIITLLITVKGTVA
jgi:predicted membrane channel-forming protein YqfA (hemolysin III family)